MANLTFPLNDIDYETKDLEAYFSTRSSGLIETGDFQIELTGLDTNISIGAGRAWLKNLKYAGKMFLSDEQVTFDLDTPPQYDVKYTYVVIKFSTLTNDTQIILKDGTNSELPIQNENQYELFLYKITRSPSDTTVTYSIIEDLRGNSLYCPYMVDGASPVDSTLTKSGWAADAKETGDRVKTVETNLTDLSTSYNKFTEKISTQKILWQGAYNMGNKSIPLSENVSSQVHGVVLVFSAWYNSQPKDENFHSFFIPKELVKMQEGRGHRFFMMGGNMTHLATKYLYINDNRINGPEVNSETGENDLPYENNYFVLRYVLGV